MKKEFDQVIWQYVHGHMVPMFDLGLPADPNFVSLQGQLDKLQIDERPPMKMTLEWEDAANGI